MRSLALFTALSASLLVATPALADPQQNLTKAGCMACHGVEKKLVGPAYKDVAAKYKGQDVTAELMEKVRKGSKGVYGPIPMTPTGPDKISDDDLKAAITWILGIS